MAVVNFRRHRPRLFVELRRVGLGHRLCRLHARVLHRHVVGLVFDLLERRLHIGVIGAALQHRLIFQDCGRKLPHLHIRLGDALGRVDHILFAPELGVGFLENFQRLAIIGLRLGNNFEHLNRLLQLSFFAGI